MYFYHHVQNLRWKDKNQVQYLILQLLITSKEKFAVIFLRTSSIRNINNKNIKALLLTVVNNNNI